MNSFDPVLAVAVGFLLLGLASLFSAAHRKAERFEFAGSLFYLEFGSLFLLYRFAPTDSALATALLVLFGAGMIGTGAVWIWLIRNRG